MKAYKGFSKGLKCREFQYEIGETYKHDGDIKLCEKGFHACEFPLDVFNYYSPGDSDFAEVEQLGDKLTEDDKTVSKEITIKARIDIAGLVGAAVEWISSKTGEKGNKASGDHSTAASSGYYSTAESLGGNTIAMVAGLNGRARVGENGCFALAYYDDVEKRNKILIGYEGVNGIKANTWYSVTDGKLTEVNDAPSS